MTFQYCFDGSIKKVNNLSVSSPRTWGCFSYGIRVSTPTNVFPTHVGVFPSSPGLSSRRRGLPHARGGVSKSWLFLSCTMASSPRTWGCFPDRGRGENTSKVFPTHVGVFLGLVGTGLCHHGLPHARGGVSSYKQFGEKRRLSSPRTWGCFNEDNC